MIRALLSRLRTRKAKRQAQKHLDWLQRNRVILPDPLPDTRSSIEQFRRIVAQQ